MFVVGPNSRRTREFLSTSEASVGVDDPSTNRLGSTVAEHLACDGVVPGFDPRSGLFFLFLQRDMTYKRANIQTQPLALPLALRTSPSFICQTPVRPRFELRAVSI